MPGPELPYAKSIANRIMVLRSLRGMALPEPDAHWSDDMHAMRRVLDAPLGKDGWRLAHAGPSGMAYRFGMAFWAAQPGSKVVLCADDRLRERPIQALVDALRSQGALIEPDELGWRIQGLRFPGGILEVDSRLSSQFASALTLVAETAHVPLEIKWSSGITSAPYLAMTQRLTQGQNLDWPPERDWSAAFVFLAAVGLRGMGIDLMGLSLDSLQGDAASMEWGPDLQFCVSGIDGGLRVEPAPGVALLASEPLPALAAWVVDFKGLPDLAMPAIVAAALQGRSGMASGLLTLNLKESPRLDATVGMLRALGCIAEQGPDWLRWTAPDGASSQAGRVSGLGRDAGEVSGLGREAGEVSVLGREAGEVSGLGREAGEVSVLGREAGEGLTDASRREAGEGLSDASRREAGEANGSGVLHLELDCLDDHRMAFCAGLIALRRPVRLRQSAAVSKSFPNFWKEFSVFGPDIELV
jgi:3-phosphoshikimate 1-carboxyvinyltransferase